MLIAKPEQIISNERGTAYKFAGGMLVNIFSISIAANVTSKIVYFPVPFLDRSYSVSATNIFSYRKTTTWTVTRDESTYMTFYPEGNSDVQRDAMVIAIGRWK